MNIRFYWVLIVLNQQIWIPDWFTSTLCLNMKAKVTVQTGQLRAHITERRHWSWTALPPQHHELSSHCLGPSPGAGVIAAVWHCGEYFAFLNSQGNFLSLTVQPATDKMCLRECCFCCCSEIIYGPCVWTGSQSIRVSCSNTEFLCSAYWQVDEQVCLCGSGGAKVVTRAVTKVVVWCLKPVFVLESLLIALTYHLNWIWCQMS